MNGQFGKDARQQSVQLIDQPGVLFGNGFQQGHGIAELLERGWIVRRGLGPFHHGEAGARQTFHGIGFAFIEVGCSIRFVFCGLPDGDRGRPTELMQMLQEVLGNDQPNGRCPPAASMRI